MEGINIPESLDAIKLSLVSGMVIPHKFKTQVPNHTPYNVLSKDVGIHRQRQTPDILFSG